MRILCLVFASLISLSCTQKEEISPSQIVTEQTAHATPTPAIAAKIQQPIAPHMTKVAENLVFESEVGGEYQYKKWPHPEAPDARYSGITEGIGYDNAENAPKLIQQDWHLLSGNSSNRLADTHPYRGKTAQQHLHEVVDILVPWTTSYNVFYQVDLPRVDGACRRAYEGFDQLRPKAKDAIRSLVFNRGTAMSGPTRTEMRDLKPAIAKPDYAKMASLERSMIRIWKGTSIERGMTARRNAEARLIESE
jgi:hypothetical protein